MNRTLDFTVIGKEKMHCAGCETRIGKALRRLEGVREVKADAPTQHIAVTVEPSAVAAEQISARLAQLGYEVKLEET